MLISRGELGKRDLPTFSTPGQSDSTWDPCGRSRHTDVTEDDVHQWLAVGTLRTATIIGVSLSEARSADPRGNIDGYRNRIVRRRQDMKFALKQIDGLLYRLVPMVSYVDCTRHDPHVIVTEQRIADLQGITPDWVIEVRAWRVKYPHGNTLATQVVEECAGFSDNAFDFVGR